MEPTELEKVLLEKLSQGLLDGFVGPELYWRQDDAFCRRMIVGGIPYYISYSKNPHCANVCPIRFNGLPVSDERCGQFG